MSYSTLEHCVGNTPLVRLRRLAETTTSTVLTKLEGDNPAGSVKDRPAYSMIKYAAERGDIKPGDTLIEATSGNTGIALAMVAAMQGYRLRLIMPENMSEERRAVMRAYGAEFVSVSEAEGMEGARDLADEMGRRGDGFVLNQFANPDNPRGHYEGTGPEIQRDTGGAITHFVASMGTTGTIMGVSQYFREHNPGVEIVGVQPAGESRIPGIRRWPPEYLPGIYDGSRVDRIIQVDADDATDTMRALAAQEGIFAGPSSGGTVWAALQLASELDNATIGAVVCDRGDRYLSTGVFD